MSNDEPVYVDPDLESPRSIMHPEIRVKLIGEDGNAFSIIARGKRAMERAGLSKEEIDNFVVSATSSPSYDELLQLMMRTFTVE